MSAWARLAVLLSFAALLWAQAGPGLRLGQQLQATHIAAAMPAMAMGVHEAGGHGAATPVGAGTFHPADAPLHHAGSHCDLCASLGWVFPPLAVCAIPCFAGEQVADADFPAHTSAAVPGLPFGRGPPSTLN